MDAEGNKRTEVENQYITKKWTVNPSRVSLGAELVNDSLLVVNPVGADYHNRFNFR